MSYQFLPSNQQVSFANTNSGSKKTSEALVQTKSSAAKDKNSTMMSNFMPGTEQSAPDAIHIDRPVKIDVKKQRGLGQIHAFERPPSCGSFKQLVPEQLFEHRKFSVESLSKNNSKQSDEDDLYLGVEENNQAN